MRSASRQLRKSGCLLRFIGRKYGLRGALRLLLDDVLFDVRHRTDTILPVHNSDLYPEGEIEERERYVPTPFRVARESIRLVGARTSLAGVNFVDMGCGKGKVLFEAARFPFAQVKGIEYSPMIFDIATRNVEKLGLQDRIVLHHGDAIHWHPGEDDRVYFFFNPFSGSVLSTVVNNICDATPPGQTIYVIYVNPQFDETFSERMRRIEQVVIEPGGVRVSFYELVG